MPPSRLFDLPVELRLIIYEYTFGDNAPEDLDLLNIQEHFPPCDLLQTSQQIYDEAHETFMRATQHFFQNKEYYLSITHDCMDEEFMKKTCRRLSQHRFKDQQTLTLRFIGLHGYGVGDYARMDLSLDHYGRLVAKLQSVRSRANRDRGGVYLQVHIIALHCKWIMLQDVATMRVGKDRLDSRVVMVYLSAIFKHKPGLGAMWAEQVKEAYGRPQKVE